MYQAAVHAAICCARAEVSCLLQALEVIRDRRRHGCPIRPGNVFNEYNLSWLILRNTPEPGVRNDGSNHPGKTLAPIEVARDQLKHALLNKGVDLIERFDHWRAVSPNTMLLGVRR